MASGILATFCSTTVLALQTYYLPWGGNINSGAATNSDAASAVKFRGTGVSIKNMRAYVARNTLTAASTIKLHYGPGGAFSDAGTISVPASTSGSFSDTTTSTALSSGYQVCIKVTAGSTGTSMDLRGVSAEVNGSTITYLSSLDASGSAFVAGTNYYGLTGRP